MIKIEDIKEDVVFTNKKGYKIEIKKVYEDFDNGSAIIRTYVHRNSETSKQYVCGHNNKYFDGTIRIKEGKKSGLIPELNNNGFKIK
jgi:hypothetical protein